MPPWGVALGVGPGRIIDRASVHPEAESRGREMWRRGPPPGRDMIIPGTSAESIGFAIPIRFPIPHRRPSFASASKPDDDLLEGRLEVLPVRRGARADDLDPPVTAEERRPI